MTPRQAWLLVGAAIVATLLRLNFWAFESVDFRIHTSQWHLALLTRGFPAFADPFDVYTPPYLYYLFLVASMAPALPSVLATKLPSMVGDFVSAWFAYRLVSIAYPRASLAPVFAAVAVLFAPTVVMNSAVWGQADSLYTAPLVAALYFLARGQGTAAWMAFGIGFATKAQAIFFAPLLLTVLLRRAVSWTGPLIVGLVYVIMILPAWIAGRSLFDLLTLYVSQTHTFRQLTKNAPTLYAWLPKRDYDVFYPAGVLFAAAVIAGLVIVTVRSGTPFTPPLVVSLALSSVLIVPFLLPKMHERYFYAADVISIIFAFYFPRRFYVPILVGTVSLLAYFPFLFNLRPVRLSYLAALLLVGIVVVVYHTARLLERGSPRRAVPAEAAHATQMD
jgi:Gpi18-like mannosyltransferase